MHRVSSHVPASSLPFTMLLFHIMLIFTYSILCCLRLSSYKCTRRPAQLGSRSLYSVLTHRTLYCLSRALRWCLVSSRSLYSVLTHRTLYCLDPPGASVLSQAEVVHPRKSSVKPLVIRRLLRWMQILTPPVRVMYLCCVVSVLFSLQRRSTAWLIRPSDTPLLPRRSPILSKLIFS